MKAQTIDVQQATGRILCCAIFRAGGKKLLAKGLVISEEDARMLETEGMNQVWVTELEEGEVGEDAAAMQVASEIGCGALEIRLAAGGRANLFTTEPCCVLVDNELLKQINCTASIAIATSFNFSYARAGQRVATVKSTPFAVASPPLRGTIFAPTQPRARSHPALCSIPAEKFRRAPSSEASARSGRTAARQALSPGRRSSGLYKLH
jgi:molybdenum cofactor cytidylyltransferase